VRGIARQLFGDRVRLRVIEPERRRSLLARLAWRRRPDLGDVAGDLLAKLEERLIWARLGL
jgi:hypothetical protein